MPAAWLAIELSKHRAFEARLEGDGTSELEGRANAPRRARYTIAGCAPDGPLGTAGAIVTAPITAPVMFVSARMNDREEYLERARRNGRPLPPIDGQSREMARETLEQALARGRIDEGLYWQNDDASGYAAGGVTVLATGRTDDGRSCREVLIETAMERRPTDQRVRTYCRDGARWGMVAFMAGAPASRRGDGR